MSCYIIFFSDFRSSQKTNNWCIKLQFAIYNFGIYYELLTSEAFKDDLATHILDKYIQTYILNYMRKLFHKVKIKKWFFMLWFKSLSSKTESSNFKAKDRYRYISHHTSKIINV